MNPGQANEYIVRINKVCDYIDTHLSEDMTLSELAGVAGFSEFHFHRIFAAMTGETLFSFIQRLRLERAATRLCANAIDNVTQIGADCGFSSPAVFSRTFKKRFGCTPTEFRNSNEGQTQSSLSQLLRNDGKANDEAQGYNGNKKWRFAMKPEVKIEKIDTMRVAYLRYVGPYAGDAELFENLYKRFFAWTGPRGIDVSTTYIIYHDDPNVTDEQKLRMSICVPIGDDVEVSGEIGEMTINGGTYAVGRFELGTEEYGEAWAYMYSEWLPQSGYQPAPDVSFERYIGSDCDESGKMKVDICIPVTVM
jgi:AraC family transcriptional regulator